MMLRLFTVVIMVFIYCLPASAQLNQILKGLGVSQPADLSDNNIVAGLKEALHIGTENAVRSTGRPGGYFQHKVIKILMPEQLQTLEQGLRMIGYGPQIDEFVLSMNRAAEQAAPLAKEIFWNAITEMSFEDARNILTGGETAATEYFKAKTSKQLSVAFRPVVKKKMNEVGVTRQYTI